MNKLITFALISFSIASFSPGAFAQEPQPVDSKEKQEQPETPSTGTIEKVEKDEAKQITYYQPIYVAYGNPSTKIQYSFRSQLFTNLPVNFGYTQMIFWKLREESKPFEDATYNPELFYRWNAPWNRWTWVDFGIWEHNSNGKGEQDSRSYDQSYVRGTYAFEWNKWALFSSVKFRLIYNVDETNKNIREFVGPMEINLHWVHLIENSFIDQAEVILTLRPGGEFATQWDQGGYQLATNFHIKGINVNPAFYLQYYHGNAETLINYDQDVDEFRFGIMF